MPQFEVMATINLEVLAVRVVEAETREQAEAIVEADIKARKLEIVYDRARHASGDYQLQEFDQYAEVDSVTLQPTGRQRQEWRERAANDFYHAKP